MKNEYYISDSQNLLSNETSQKMAKEVSQKYHQFLEMYHKNANKKQKNTVKKQNVLLKYRKKLQKHIKNPCFQAINIHFSRYNKNFY